MATPAARSTMSSGSAFAGSIKSFASSRSGFSGVGGLSSGSLDSSALTSTSASAFASAPGSCDCSPGFSRVGFSNSGLSGASGASSGGASP